MTAPKPRHRVDFHLHSYASNVTDYFAANSFAIPESYSDPFALHRDLKARGMSLVTLTDHNSIDGARRLLDAGKTDVFLSSEMTATFPEDGCNVHITVANVTEAQFREVDRLRGNVYDMIDFVAREIENEKRAPAGNRIACFMTHPLMSTQNRPYGREGSLTVEHLEKLLLLLDAFEVRNGTRTRALNELTARWIASLDRETIERLADVHGIAPRGETPWKKAILGGSDDHSGLNPGRTFTEFEFDGSGPLTGNDVVDAIRARRTAPGGEHGGPVTLAHSLLKLVHDGGTRRSAGEKAIGVSGPIGSLLELAFGSPRRSRTRGILMGAKAIAGTIASRLLPDRGAGVSHSFEKTFEREARALLLDASFQQSLAARRTDDRIFCVVSRLLDRIFARYVERIASAQSLDLVRVIKEVVALVSSNLFVSLPYLLSYLHQSSDRFIVRDVRSAFRLSERPKNVLITDTLFDVNGVAKTIRRIVEESKRRGIELTVVTCLDPAERARHLSDPQIASWIESGNLVVFDSIVSCGMPRYDGLRLRVPPFLELLKFLQESGFAKMQISTPGTVGLAGLLAAKILQLETSSTYHTSFPEYVEDYTRDVSLEALAWKYMILFYHSVDEVVVPSKFIARLLHRRGLRKKKLLVLDRWVDTRRFSPERRDDAYWSRHGLSRQSVKFVYVGRLGVEKDLGTLAEAFRRLCATNRDVVLCLIGDGPYRAELARSLSGLPAVFTGFLTGAELETALASCDAKVFPSTTDTWGNAPLEAQASGLPVVVSDQGGPQELMIDGVTGFRVPGRNVRALHDAMTRLLDPELRVRMGGAARTFAERNRIDEPFSAILDSAGFRARAKRDESELDDRDAIRADDAPPDILRTEFIEEIELAGVPLARD